MFGFISVVSKPPSNNATRSLLFGLYIDIKLLYVFVLSYVVFIRDVLWYGIVCRSVNGIRSNSKILFRIISFLDTKYIATYLRTLLETRIAAH